MDFHLHALLTSLVIPTRNLPCTNSRLRCIPKVDTHSGEAAFRHLKPLNTLPGDLRHSAESI